MKDMGCLICWWQCPRLKCICALCWFPNFGSFCFFSNKAPDVFVLFGVSFLLAYLVFLLLNWITYLPRAESSCLWCSVLVKRLSIFLSFLINGHVLNLAFPDTLKFQVQGYYWHVLSIVFIIYTVIVPCCFIYLQFRSFKSDLLFPPRLLSCRRLLRMWNSACSQLPNIYTGLLHCRNFKPNLSFMLESASLPPPPALCSCFIAHRMGNVLPGPAHEWAAVICCCSQVRWANLCMRVWSLGCACALSNLCWNSAQLPHALHWTCQALRRQTASISYLKGNNAWACFRIWDCRVNPVTPTGGMWL